MNVDILLYDGFDELDGIAPYEVFDYALTYATEGVKGARVPTMTATATTTPRRRLRDASVT